MMCGDFMLRVCSRNPCQMHHGVQNCQNSSCNRNKLCKKVHLKDYEVFEIDQNIRPFRQSIYQEMKRLAYLLRETFPTELKVHTCTLNMLNECVWPCLTCGTAPRDESTITCNKCYIISTQENIEILRCRHIYCKYCLDISNR